MKIFCLFVVLMFVSILASIYVLSLTEAYVEWATAHAPQVLAWAVKQ